MIFDVEEACVWVDATGTNAPVAWMERNNTRESAAQRVIVMRISREGKDFLFQLVGLMSLKIQVQASMLILCWRPNKRGEIAAAKDELEDYL